ncbi:hypothetical protein [Paraurantiacibacter namhicola]|uniref:Lipoprotein n=1 Tax=Paraurantiacibacter namhicola TaxID=645517 RepID=A0A1C7D719_9SPHN|nr:hypothetical protein [Paraurantiacibacter namhicola]ANU07245.1 hypothetical protein A6F65_00935 [Paraurantiacibacter namhicola]
MRLRPTMLKSALLAPVLLALSACGSDAETADGDTAAADASAVDAEGAVAAEAPETETAAAPDTPAQSDMISFDTARDLTVTEFAEEAAKRLKDQESWQPGAPVTITGPVAGIILDEPPETYLTFGPDQARPIMFAIMRQPFAAEMQYQKEGFYSSDRRAAITCRGPVTRVQGDGPLVIDACDPLYRF